VVVEKLRHLLCNDHECIPRLECYGVRFGNRVDDLQGPSVSQCSSVSGTQLEIKPHLCMFAKKKSATFPPKHFQSAVLSYQISQPLSLLI
jgi:hypothetical protein